MTFVPVGNSVLTASQNAGPIVVFCNAPVESTPFKRATSSDAFQYVESAVMPPIRTCAGVPARVTRLSRRLRVKAFGEVMLPIYSITKAVSMLKLASAGFKADEAVCGSEAGPESLKVVVAREAGKARYKTREGNRIITSCSMAFYDQGLRAAISRPDRFVQVRGSCRVVTSHAW